MGGARTPSSLDGQRRRRLLLATLIGLGAIYLALLPWQRRMAAETERLHRATAAGQAEAVRLAGLRRALDAARARAERDPPDAQAQFALAQRCSEAGQLDRGAPPAPLAPAPPPRDPPPRPLPSPNPRRGPDYP